MVEVKAAVDIMVEVEAVVEVESNLLVNVATVKNTGTRRLTVGQSKGMNKSRQTSQKTLLTTTTKVSCFWLSQTTDTQKCNFV